jgi:hypothetical protein
MKSTSVERVVNREMRHGYRVLSDEEKVAIHRIRNFGRRLHAFVETLEEDGRSRELSLAKTKVEEAVMWTVKHITK